MGFRERINDLELMNISMAKDGSPENLEKLHKQLAEIEAELAKGSGPDGLYDSKKDRTPDRVDLNQKVRFFKRELNSKIGGKFGHDDILSIEVKQILQNARTAIKSMTISNNTNRDKDSEKKARDLINSLTLRQGDERPLMVKDHPEVVKLWQDYKHKKAMNFIAYAQQGSRSIARDEAIRRQLTENEGNVKFTDEDVQAVMNALEGRKPTE